MPSQTFTPGSYNFDHVGKTNISFVIRSAGGNGTVGDGSGNEGGNGGGGGGACVIGSIPDAHLVDAASLMLYVPGGGSSASALIQINGGIGDGLGIYATSGGENSAGGSGGDLDGDELGWCASALQGGSGSSIGGVGGGGGGAGTPDGDGLGADGNGGGVDGSGNPSGGNGGYELTPGQNAYGIGGGGGGGTFYGDPVTSAPAGSGGDGQITLTWDAVGVAQLQHTLSTGITTGL